jgi:HK97 family phage major capsid protein
MIMPDNETEEKRTAPTLTFSQAKKRAEEVHARMEEINELDEPTVDENEEFRGLSVEFDELVTHVERLERSAELAAVRTKAERIPGRRLSVERGSNSQGSRDDYDRDSILEPDSIEDHRFRNPWDLSEVRTFGREPGEVAGELRSRALSAIEKMQGASDNIRQAATHIIERFDSKDSKLARQCLVTSSPEYLRAWSKMAVNKGHTLTVAEQRAMNEVEQFRAMSLTDSAGGYLVPFQLDPTVIVTSNGVRNDIRQAARTVVATGDTWNGVSAGNVSWSFDAEASEVSDDSPTFAQPSIPNYMARGFVPISIEAMDDEQNVAQEVGMLLAGGKEDLEALKFILGSGSGEPTGIVTALVASSPTVIVNSASTDTFALADVYSLQGALPARYRANSSWLSNNLIYNKIRQFDTAGGNGAWQQLGDGRASVLMGRPALEAESVDGVINTSAENYSLIVGDFSNYVITDRIGMSVEFIPHLFHTSNNRPSGQRGWFARYRTGADSVNDGAFRILDIT